MESLRDLFIKLGLSVDAASFAEGLAWEHALEKGAELIKEAFEEVPEFIKEAIEKTAEYGEQMELLAQKTGISTDNIQKLAYAASLSGSSADALRVGVSHLARELEAANGGAEESVKHFTSLGLSMGQLRNKSPDEVLKLMADRFQKLGPGFKSQAAAMDLLGRGGTELLPMMLKGSEGIERLGIAAEETGYVMSEEAVKAAAEFEDAVKSLHLDVEGLTHELAGPFIEALAPIIESFQEWFKANRAIISQKIKAFAEGIITVARALGKTIVGLVKTIGWMVDHVKLLAVVLGSVLVAAVLASDIALGQLLVNFVLNTAAAIAYAAVTTWAALSTAAAWLAAAAPIVLIAAGLVLAALAAEDFYTFIKGGDSVLGHLLNTYGERFTKFMDDLVAPKAGDGWLVSYLKATYGWLVDIQPVLDKVAAGFEWLAYGGDKAHHVKGAWETASSSEMAESAAEQAQRIKTTQAIYGGGGSPGASAAAAQAGSNFVNAPSLHMPVTIVQGPGQSGGAIADALTQHLDDWWDTKMRQAAPLAPAN